MNYCIFYLIIFSFTISKDFNEFFLIELNHSNLANSVYNGENHNEHIDQGNQLGVKLAYIRKDSRNINSGFGVQYINNTDQNLIDNSNAKNPNLYGASFNSFIYKSIWSLEIGMESIYHLGATGKDFILGPRIGYTFKLFGINLNLNYFIGYIDLINFERYKDENKLLDMSHPVSQIGFSVFIPKSNN